MRTKQNDFERISSGNCERTQAQRLGAHQVQGARSKTIYQRVELNELRRLSTRSKAGHARFAKAPVRHANKCNHNSRKCPRRSIHSRPRQSHPADLFRERPNTPWWMDLPRTRGVWCCIAVVKTTHRVWRTT